MASQPRYWGVWTAGKLELLNDYLDKFTTASKSQREIIYLDLFGGQPENRQRHTNETLDGSARIALGIKDPPFSKLRFFELEAHAIGLDAKLRAEFGDRDFEVIAGDCNETVPGVLAKLQEWNWAPTFAFVDPNGPDVAWTTLKALSEFKKKNRTKTEIWLLLADGMFIRTLVRSGNVSSADAAKLTLMYGTEQWREIYQARIAGLLEPAQAREEYVNLMRWRLENVLGYRWTHPLEVFNEHNRSIYHMIFATDHEVGTKIMTSLYRRSAKRFPQMAEAARRQRERLREEEQGVQALFEESLENRPSVVPLERPYEYIRPWAPLGYDSP